MLGQLAWEAEDKHVLAHDFVGGNHLGPKAFPHTPDMDASTNGGVAFRRIEKLIYGSIG